MKSAPVIVIAEVLDYKLISGPRQVERPSDALNPRASIIPLHLARMSANVLFSLRGGVKGKFEFYSWVWASGNHGGARLFSPNPGYIHTLFLHFEGGYLHTVGDYPAYDLGIPNSLVSAITSRLQPSPGNPSDLFERIVAACVTAELANHARTPPSGNAPLCLGVGRQVSRCRVRVGGNDARGPRHS